MYTRGPCTVLPTFSYLGLSMYKMVFVMLTITGGLLEFVFWHVRECIRLPDGAAWSLFLRIRDITMYFSITGALKVLRLSVTVAAPRF